MAGLLHLNPRDNVAVVTEGMSDVRPGHKVATRAIAAGDDVIKYGWPIGCATRDIAEGEWVHTHNCVTRLEGVTELSYEPKLSPVAIDEPAPTFMGYRRANGRVGTRNEIWIVNTVGCVNQASLTLAQMAGEGVYAFPHPYGCSQLGDDLKNTQKALAGLIQHPNAGGVLVLGLGCENNMMREQMEQAGPVDANRVRFFNAQDVTDEIESGLEKIAELKEYAGSFQREPCPVSDLVLGMKCGGSDGFSGITANPLVGAIADRVTSWGGTVILTEVPEMFGAEKVLGDRARDVQTFQRFAAMIDDFKRYMLDNRQPIYENPSPGNKEGGITTLEEKSLGCVQKGGRATVTEVRAYGEPVRERGLSLVSAPGNDAVSTTAEVIAGATLLLFTTGRGTPLGTPVPTIKISTNTALAQRKPKWIDFDAGRLLDGASIDSLSRDLMTVVIDVASGRRRARNEENNMREFAIFKTGVTL